MVKIQSDTFESETPQRKRYVIGKLKDIMKDNNLKSFRALDEYLQNPNTSEETNWSFYINGSTKKSLDMINNKLKTKLTKTKKIKEKIFETGKFKQFGNIERLQQKKFGYICDKKIQIFVEKRLYRNEFQIIARDKKGRFASFVKKKN
jgi:hypothetical protein